MIVGPLRTFKGVCFFGVFCYSESPVVEEHGSTLVRGLCGR